MRKLLLLILAIGFIVPVFAKEIPARPNTLVNDYAGVLSSSEKSSLEQMLVAYDDSTSNQIAIVIEGSLDGEDAFTRSVDIAEKWGVGDKENDNGILIYVAINDHKMFIQVGRGLEGVIPDALAGRIIDNEITPFFKLQQYYQGLLGGSKALMKAAAGEYKAKPKKKTKGLPGWMLGLFVLFLIIFVFGGRKMRGTGTYGRRGHYSGGWGMGGGGWSSGGGGGGGFGGFGGGSFGGGGAGGNW